MKIVVFGVFFGNFPVSFPMWMDSALGNPEIRWVIYTDNPMKNRGNVEFHPLTLQGFNQLASERMNLPVAITKPYKVCDFRPVYATLFQEELKGCDFWGHCDFDVVWGNIRKFITNAILSQNDKILFAGHFSLYRNTPQINGMWKVPVNGMSLGNLFCNDINRAFDENFGIYLTLLASGKRIYRKMVYADISPVITRFTLSSRVARQIGIRPVRNHARQVFYREDGKILRTYLQRGILHTDEFMYIHIQKRKLQILGDSFSTDSFYLHQGGYEAKNRLPTTKRTLYRLSPWKPISEARQEFMYDFAWQWSTLKRMMAKADLLLSKGK